MAHTNHTSVPNSTYEVPTGTMRTRFEPSLPRMSAWKNIKLHTRTRNPFISYKYFDIGPSKPKSCWCEDPSWGNKSVKPVSDRQEWQSMVVLNGTNIDLWESLVSCFSGPMIKYFLLMQGSQVQIQGVKVFSWWHPLEAIGSNLVFIIPFGIL